MTIKEQLIQKAQKAYGRILPVGGKQKHDRSCFCVYTLKGRRALYFWFDTPDGSTHIVNAELTR